MGAALLNVWSKQTNNSFFVVDPTEYQKINIKYKNRVKAYENINHIKDLSSIGCVIFAIKPQIASKVLERISKINFKKKTIFVSIVAGKKINYFEKKLSSSIQFVRVMPNMPVFIKQGMSCMIANANVSLKNKKIVSVLFSGVGKILWLKNDMDIDKVTAISGSGPGYIYLFIDAFEAASKKLGLGEKNTKDIIHQTFLGSIMLLMNQKKSASILVKNIAVKGGTTEAGLNKFKKKDILHKIFEKAIDAAFIKAKKLGK